MVHLKMSETGLARLTDGQDCFLHTNKNPANPNLSEAGYTGLKDVQDLVYSNDRNPVNPKIKQILMQTIKALI